MSHEGLLVYSTVSLRLSALVGNTLSSERVRVAAEVWVKGMVVVTICLSDNTGR